MTDTWFIFMLLLGGSLLAGILGVAHLSAYRLAQRKQAADHHSSAASEKSDLALPS